MKHGGRLSRVKRRGGTLLVISALLLGLAAIPAAQGAGSASVTGKDFKFVQSRITVPAGTKVTWKWTGIHNVHGRGWGSGLPKSGGRYSRVFRSAGKFTYICQPHQSLGMKGVVIVK